MALFWLHILNLPAWLQKQKRYRGCCIHGNGPYWKILTEEGTNQTTEICLRLALPYNNKSEQTGKQCPRWVVQKLIRANPGVGVQEYLEWTATRSFGIHSGFQNEWITTHYVPVRTDIACIPLFVNRARHSQNSTNRVRRTITTLPWENCCHLSNNGSIIYE